MRWCFLVFVIAACGSKPPPQHKKTCDSPGPGQAMSEAQCQCIEGRVVLELGKAVEIHCEADEHELGAAKIGDRAGWCCK